MENPPVWEPRWPHQRAESLLRSEPEQIAVGGVMADVVVVVVAAAKRSGMFETRKQECYVGRSARQRPSYPADRDDCMNVAAMDRAI